MTAQFTKFRKPKFCTNAASALGPYMVSIGDLVVFRQKMATVGEDDEHYENQLGRVLAGVKQLPDGTKPQEEMLLVLAADDALTFAYERYVLVSDIMRIRHRPELSSFMKWFLQGEMPDPQVAIDVIKYGAMNDRYLDEYLTPDNQQIDPNWRERNKPSALKKLEYTVNYSMTCHGSVGVKADSQQQADSIVENMALSDLAREADDGEVDTVSFPSNS